MSSSTILLSALAMISLGCGQDLRQEPNTAPPDAQAEALTIAGPAAIQCGKAQARWGQDWTAVKAVSNCVLRAQEKNKAFVAELELLGVDTSIDTVYSRDSVGHSSELWNGKVATFHQTCVGKRSCGSFGEDFSHSDGTNPSGLSCQLAQEATGECTR